MPNTGRRAVGARLPVQADGERLAAPEARGSTLRPAPSSSTRVTASISPLPQRGYSLGSRFSSERRSLPRAWARFKYSSATLSAVPCSTTSPWSISTTCWHMLLIAPMSCDTNTVVLPLLAELVQAVDALALEVLVADRERLVDHQDVGIDAGGDGEAQAHVHARAVGLDRALDELAELGEVDDRREALLDLRLAHAQDRAVQADVLAPGELGVEARAELEQRSDPALDARPRRWSAR